MNIAELDLSLNRYERTLNDFVEGFGLPRDLFQHPDHFAIKCASEIDYIQTCDVLSGEVNGDGIWELNIDNRLLASAELVGRISLSGSYFSWVEIMQPKPGKETESGFVEHTEFLFPDFFVVTELLKNRGIDYTVQENPGHKWVNVLIDDHGREIKFNDKLLSEVVVRERADGLLTRLVEEA